MPIVRIKIKGQVTLPETIRTQAGLTVGDFLEVKIEKGKITLAPQSLVARAVAESMADYKAGRYYGPFDSVDELFKSLSRESKKHRRRKK